MLVDRCLMWWTSQKSYRICSSGSVCRPRARWGVACAAVLLWASAASPRARAAGPSETALQAAAAGITSVADAAGAAHGVAAAVVDGSRAASDALRTAVEVAAQLLQVPPVALGQRDPPPDPQPVYVYAPPPATTPPHGGGGGLLASLFGR
ncbi:hypothetical protein R5R35_012382 [Gryllus longicercus]|uniref:Uncharacterized protein n=1 Tax=Gryllus longicercus TaxID=2509291 RepID=A0AAN9VXP8_9ORTH